MGQNMDQIVTPGGGDWFRTAVLLRANHFQFERGDDYWVRAIGSRMLFWGIAGRGALVVEDVRHEIAPGDALLLPWMVDVRYLADVTEPFLTGAAHLLPWHDPEVPVVPWAAHGPRDALHGLSERRDRPWPGLEGCRRLSPRTARQVVRLGEAAVQDFADDRIDEPALRAYGLLLAGALHGEERTPASEGNLPTDVLVVLEFVRSHIADPISTQTLADVGGCSVSTVERRFRLFTDLTPMAWVRRERLRFAADVLRTSRRKVNEVAREVGFADPLHFSREFHREFGYPPSHLKSRTPLT